MSEPIRMDGQYQTRDGREVRVLCVDAKGTQPVVALVSDDDCEFVRRYNADGLYNESGCTGPSDLVPVRRRNEP